MSSNTASTNQDTERANLRAAIGMLLVFAVALAVARPEWFLNYLAWCVLGLAIRLPLIRRFTLQTGDLPSWLRPPAFVMFLTVNFVTTIILAPVVFELFGSMLVTAALIVVVVWAIRQRVSS
jgi:hypothetical protein